MRLQKKNNWNFCDVFLFFFNKLLMYEPLCCFAFLARDHQTVEWYSVGYIYDMEESDDS